MYVVRYLCGKYLLPCDYKAGAGSFANGSTDPTCHFRNIEVECRTEDGSRHCIVVTVLETKKPLIFDPQTDQYLTVNYSSMTRVETEELLKGELAVLKSLFVHLP